MKWVRRILVTLIVAIIIMIVVIAGIIGWDVNFGANATDFTNISYIADDGTTLNAYLAIPDGEGLFPAVLMVHEWWGLNEEIVELADKLAAEGYIVLAPDTYRGPTTWSVPAALYLRLNVDMKRVDDDMLVAYNYLAELPDVDGNIGIVGFCYGGDVAFNHGIANTNIDAVVNLYGSTLADSSMFGALLNDDAPPVLGIFGAADTTISIADVDAYEVALNEAGIENTVTIYDGMNHAFVQPDAIEEAGAPQDAWNQILAFFDLHLLTQTSS